MPEERDLGPVRLQFGTYEDAKKSIGAKGPLIKGRSPVNKPMIELYNAAAENPNPCYWDEEYAKQRFGGLLCPPSMVSTFTMGAIWEPAQFKAKQAEGGDVTMPPLPGDTVINVSTETEFLRPVIAGDMISSQDELVAITSEKKTRIGIGHFITTRANLYNQKGELVATNTNTLYRYKAGTGS